jgi:hypothetical protein
VSCVLVAGPALRAVRSRCARISLHSDSVLIKNCTGAHVYLLDHSSDVEVVGCRNCEIYVTRPVDGPALFEGCVDCRVVLASQQFQARQCQDCSFGIYCVTGPALSNCSRIKISPWSGDKVTNLDPTKNQFLNVYDASQADGEERNFAICFDPVQVMILDVRKRGDSQSSEELRLAFDSGSGEGRENREDGGSIKAIKANEGSEDSTWHKTLELIDMSNNKRLSRFKSVLLSMTDEENREE